MPIYDEKGNWINSRGNPIPPKVIDPVIKREDYKTFTLLKKAAKGFKYLFDLRDDIQAAIDDLCKFAGKKGKTIVSKNGYITLTDYAHNFKIEINSQDITDFNMALLQSAKEKFDKCVQKWSQDARPELILLISDAFDVNKRGRINKTKLFELLAISINDKDWQAAQEYLRNSIFSDRTKTYMRFYIRDKKRKWHYLPLDFSKIDESNDNLLQIIEEYFPKKKRSKSK